MLEIRITAPELSEAINNLAKAMTAHAETTPFGKTSSVALTNTTCATADIVRAATTAVAPENAPVPTAVPAPVAPVTPSPVAAVPVAPAVPTAAPQYTLEMIAKAGTALIDAGKMNELTALLARYGVEALTALDPAHYGVFANELRSLGAAI